MIEQRPLFDDPEVLAAPRIKRCIVCGAVKPVADFYADPRYPRRFMSKCKACTIAANVANRKSERGSRRDRLNYYRHRDATLAAKQSTREKYRKSLMGRASRLLKSARERAAKRGLPATITSEWIAERIACGVCSVTGIPFDLSTPHGPYTPSVDRINSREGYTPENTQIVVFIYNLAKRDWGHAEVSAFARVVASLDKGKSGAA